MKNKLDFLKNNKVQWIIVGVLLLAIIIFGSYIRLQNLPLLIDQTTGKSIPLALDPFYFLRVAETIVANDGILPEVDVMRIKAEPMRFTNEILPYTVVYMWKVVNMFGEYSIQFVHNISPVVYFILGLIVFFSLIYSLTNSKLIVLLSSLFLSITSSYLYRTMAGFADHEAIGMFAFFTAMLFYSFCLKWFEKEGKKNLLKTILFSIILGFLTTLTIVSWGGVSKYLFLIIPISFLLVWLVKTQKINEKILEKLPTTIIFYVGWVLFTILIPTIFGISPFLIIQTSFLRATGIIGIFVLCFIIVDYLIMLRSKNINKLRVIYSFIITSIIGLISLLVIKGDLSIISNMFSGLLDPFGTDRLGLTVVENRQPYLMNWINQVGSAFFWAFYIGIIFIGLNISKGIKKVQEKVSFSLVWVLFISGILFSRLSSSSVLNGDNFISKLIYFSSFLVFGGYLIWFHIKEEIEVDSVLILIASWMFIVLISARGAMRFFFVLAPFVYFMSSYALLNLYNYAKNSKEEIVKWGGYIFLCILIIGLISGSINAAKVSMQQGKVTGPSANTQWQKSMEWIRDNTNEGSIFAHWWDYGYWVTYLGERPVISDGGHFEGTFKDHMIGRYLLTNPFPNSAMSFMKSNNVSYLLIDQTDIGKYTAYSSIGSNYEWDRMSAIITMNSNPSEIQETSTGEKRIYSGTSGVGDDIIYKENETTIFLPGATFNTFGTPSYKSFMIGVLLETNQGVANVKSFQINQPNGVFFYDNKQVEIPLRYVYFGDRKIDFGTGINAGIKIIPKVYSSGAGLQIDQLGSALYFCPRTIDSLVVQLFILGDPDNRYPTINLSHSEDHPFVEDLKKQGATSDDFIVYRGLNGPIKIFEVNYNNDILVNEEFTRYSGKWAEFDELEVVR